MALGPRLDLRQTQSLVMTPQLQQAIKLLTLSNLELETFIGEALEAVTCIDTLKAEEGSSDSSVAKALGIAPSTLKRWRIIKQHIDAAHGLDASQYAHLSMRSKQCKELIASLSARPRTHTHEHTQASSLLGASTAPSTSAASTSTSTSAAMHTAAASTFAALHHKGAATGEDADPYTQTDCE